MIGVLATVLEIMFVALLVMLPAIYMMSFVIGAFTTLPYASNVYVQSIYSTIVGIFDNSFLFIFIIVIFGDVYISYVEPSRTKAIENIFAFFMVAWFYALFAQLFTAFNSLQFSTLMPSTSAFFLNGYYIVFTFFAIILCIIFNLNKVNPQSDQVADVNSYPSRVTE